VTDVSPDAAMPMTIDCDVLVCGGGVAGTMAAVAAARSGARVVLAERYGFLGGNATAGAVSQFNSWQTAGGRRVVAGLADEVVSRLRQYGAAGEHEVFTMSTGHTMDRVEYAPEVLKLVLDEMAEQAGVTLLLHAQLFEVATSERTVQLVRMLTKSGLVSICPAVLVDCSGDIDALRQAGAQFLTLGDGEQLQPATMMFRFGPVDFERFDGMSKDQFRTLARQGFDDGHLARAALHAARVPYTRDAWFNISRLGIDATDAMALSRAEVLGRRQAWDAAAYLRAVVPGCEQGRLVAFATQVGVRETRRIKGDHVLSAHELLEPVSFADAIAAGAYPIDIHPASGGGLVYHALQDDHAYQIPYRCLIPTALDNALVAGRGISATHEALAAIRVMTISMAVGQAAGTAAALAVHHNGRVRDVALASLRQTLKSNGACIGD